MGCFYGEVSVELWPQPEHRQEYSPDSLLRRTRGGQEKEEEGCQEEEGDQEEGNQEEEGCQEKEEGSQEKEEGSQEEEGCQEKEEGSQEKEEGCQEKEEGYQEEEVGRSTGAAGAAPPLRPADDVTTRKKRPAQLIGRFYFLDGGGGFPAKEFRPKRPCPTAIRP
ncbi:MAG: hypothetical protein V3R99_05060 [Thermoguttaceae bacterium]